MEDDEDAEHEIDPEEFWDAYGDEVIEQEMMEGNYNEESFEDSLPNLQDNSREESKLAASRLEDVDEDYDNELESDEDYQRARARSIMDHQRESSIFTKKDLGLAKIAGPARKSRVMPLMNYTD